MLTHPAIPRATFTLLSAQLRHRVPHLRRHASHPTTPPPKPRVLSQPDKFRPPSHGQRLRKPSPYRGPPLNEQQRQDQRTRRYPHMFPPEGSRMHWFLTNRYLHAGITMTILLCLTLSLPLVDFLNTTPYVSLLPPNSLVWSHPFAFLSRYAEVYRMHTDYTSQQTAERRRQKVEDVRKRSEFRKAHGLEEESMFGGWTAKTDAEVMGPGMRESGEVGPGMEVGMTGRSAELPGDGMADREVEKTLDERAYVDFEGRKQDVDKKKWLGIW